MVFIFSDLNRRSLRYCDDRSWLSRNSNTGAIQYTHLVTTGHTNDIVSLFVCFFVCFFLGGGVFFL